MASTSTIKDAFERNQYDLATAAKKSRSWFEQEVMKMTRQQWTPPKILKGNPTEITQKILPGYLYMYLYDPKTKADLPYYDRFPLVFPFRKTTDGFIGLNMHYLPYNFRILLLDRLMIFANNKRIDESTRLKYKWQLIDGVSRYQMAKPCIKQYLSSHVKSQFRRIPSNNWATAMLLPVERFVGGSKQEVFADSLKIARKR